MGGPRPRRARSPAVSPSSTQDPVADHEAAGRDLELAELLRRDRLQLRDALHLAAMAEDGEVIPRPARFLKARLP